MTQWGRIAAAQAAQDFAQYGEARTVYKQALTLVVKHGLAPIALNVYTDLAALMIQEGESQKALELLSPVVQHPASFCETKEKAQRLLSDLHKDFAAIFLFSDFAYRL